MFERFTAETRAVIMVAQEASYRLNLNDINLEQILIALTDEKAGIAYQALQSVGLDSKKARAFLEKPLEDSGIGVTSRKPKTVFRIGPFPIVIESTSEAIFTKRSKRLLLIASELAKKMGHDYIGPEHLLLGLIDLEEKQEALLEMTADGLIEKNEALPPKLLENLGINLTELKNQVLQLIKLHEKKPK